MDIQQIDIPTPAPRTGDWKPQQQEQNLSKGVPTHFPSRLAIAALLGRRRMQCDKSQGARPQVPEADARCAHATTIA